MTREEAIEIVKKHGILADGTKFESALRELIPELAESEDERIKKIITDSVFYQYGAGVEYKDVLDYLDKLEKQKDLTTENIYKHSRERMSFWNGQQKEQKPAESISQLTVQGKGVYKICPRCKERMVRDDSMIYTSMPPQYRYECPKCGESECDTVMYDNPEMEEQKPAEWSEEDADILNCCISSIEEAKENRYAYKETDGDTSYDHEIAWLKSLRPQPKRDCKDCAMFLNGKCTKPHWKPSEDELAKKHLDGYCMGREDTLREMKDFVESHFNCENAKKGTPIVYNTQSGTSTLKAEG